MTAEAQQSEPSSVVFAAIVPHPPILIPEIGGERISHVLTTKRSLSEVARRISRSAPETIVLISPHSPADGRAFLARASPILSGDFVDFRAPQVRVGFSNDLALLDAIERECHRHGIVLHQIAGSHPLDHGALVPLYYVSHEGWRGRVAVASFTSLSDREHLAFGKAIRSAAQSVGRRIAVLASGDLSHRLSRDGPYDFEPQARFFDEAIVQSIRNSSPEEVLAVDKDLRTRAGECGYRSIVVALGAVDDRAPLFEVLSYESPFGVGYLVADLTREPDRET